jgi:hypothetical protein
MKILLGLVGLGLLGLAPLGAFAERDGVRTRDVRKVASNEGRLGGPLPTLKAIERKAKLAEKKAAEAAERKSVEDPAAVAAQMNRVMKAKRWSDITDQLKGVMPGNVVKEFGEFAASLPYPSRKKTKNGLELTSTDGDVAVIAFGRDGTMTVNGMPWRLRPLATTAEEVARLAAFIDGEAPAGASLFDRIMPAARAAGGLSAGASGVAAAALAGGNAWKSDACDEVELSDELNEDCPPMAVGMQSLIVQVKGGKKDPEEFLPVNLKCPAENGGVLELISKNRMGHSQRVRWAYAEDSITKISVDTADAGVQFKKFVNLDLSKDTPEGYQGFLEAMEAQAQALKGSVCSGSKKEKTRYFASLEANRSQLRAQVSNDGTVDSSIEAL